MMYCYRLSYATVYKSRAETIGRLINYAKMLKISLFQHLKN